MCEAGYGVSVHARSARRRVTGHVLTVATLVVAAHVVVLCVSGGHLWSAYVRNVRALQLDLPLAVLLVLIMARWLVGRPARRAALTPPLFFFAILFIYFASPRPFGSGDTMPERRGSPPPPPARTLRALERVVLAGQPAHQSRLEGVDSPRRRRAGSPDQSHATVTPRGVV